MYDFITQKKGLPHFLLTSTLIIHEVQEEINQDCREEISRSIFIIDHTE